MPRKKNDRPAVIDLEDIAISYLRFSHPDQAHGDSYRRQTAKRDEWLARNNVRLDTSLSLEDKGVSGFTGEHRSNPDRHALAAFLQIVREGRVKRGTYLIVENLDRLSREDITPALSLFLELLEAGIRVVQLLPVETVFEKNSPPMQIMMAIMELARGHSESAMKSERGGAAWDEKRRQAATFKTPLTARGPGWLHLVDGEWYVIEHAAETVRQIFRWAIAGYGIGTITKRLNGENRPVVGRTKRSKHWAGSSVAKILANRAVLGEYQPHTGRGVKREKDGEPIAGYYPAIVTEQDWYAARAAMASRETKPGRQSEDRVNVFASLLHDARDGSTLHQVSKHTENAGRSLVSYRARQGLKGSSYVSFPFLPFETAILSRLREIDPKDVLPRSKAVNKSLVVSGQITELEGEIAKLKARLQTKYSDAVADVLERQEEGYNLLLAERDRIKQEEASPLPQAWTDCHSLIDAVQKAPDQEDARIRLRAAIRRTTEEVWCLFVRRGAFQIAAVQVWFAGGSHRDYLIVHRRAQGGSVKAQPAATKVGSLPKPVQHGEIDLRRREDAADLEKELLAMNLHALMQ